MAWVGLGGLLVISVFLFVERQNKLQALEAQLARAETTCMVTEREIRSETADKQAVWLKVSWSLNGQPYMLQEPIRWTTVDASMESSKVGYQVGQSVPCRVSSETPSVVYPDTTGGHPMAHRLGA